MDRIGKGSIALVHNNVYIGSREIDSRKIPVNRAEPESSVFAGLQSDSYAK